MYEGLPFPYLMKSSSVDEARYIKVYLVEWCEQECLAESGIPADSLKLWQGAAKHNNIYIHCIRHFQFLVVTFINMCVHIYMRVAQYPENASRYILD